MLVDEQLKLGPDASPVSRKECVAFCYDKSLTVSQAGKTASTLLGLLLSSMQI